MTNIKTLQVRLTTNEKNKLDSYCKATGRTFSDVITEFIRFLPDN